MTLYGDDASFHMYAINSGFTIRERRVEKGSFSPVSIREMLGCEAYRLSMRFARFPRYLDDGALRYMEAVPAVTDTGGYL